MIVAMKKIFVITQSQEANETVRCLRSLGVLHVEHQAAPQSQDVFALQEDLSLASACCDVFAQTRAEPKAYSPGERLAISDWKAQARHITDLWKRYDQLEVFGRNLANSIALWETWGDFEPEEIREIKQKGIYIKFYFIANVEVAEV